MDDGILTGRESLEPALCKEEPNMAPTQNNRIAMVYCAGGSRAKRRGEGKPWAPLGSARPKRWQRASTQPRMAGMLLRWERMKLTRVSKGSWRRIRRPPQACAAWRR